MIFCSTYIKSILKSRIYWKGGKEKAANMTQQISYINILFYLSSKLLL